VKRLIVVVLTFAAVFPARAQRAPAPASGLGAAKRRTVLKSNPLPAEPQVQSASYGYWLLRCIREGAQKTRIGEVMLTISTPGLPEPLAQIALC
jgi:hypothetical protein